MNRVILKSPMQLEHKNNENDKHLGRYKTVKTSKTFLSITMAYPIVYLIVLFITRQHC